MPKIHPSSTLPPTNTQPLEQREEPFYLPIGIARLIPNTAITVGTIIPPKKTALQSSPMKELYTGCLRNKN